MVRLKIGINTKVPDVLASLAAASDFATCLEGVCHFALIVATCLDGVSYHLSCSQAWSKEYLMFCFISFSVNLQQDTCFSATEDPYKMANVDHGAQV